MAYITNKTDDITKEELESYIKDKINTHYPYIKLENSIFVKEKLSLSSKISNLPDTNTNKKEFYLKYLSYEFIQQIAKDILNPKYIVESKVFHMNDDIIKIKQYVKFDNIVGEIIDSNKNEDIIFLTNGKISSVLADSYKFISPNPGEPIYSNGTPYTTGAYDNIEVFTNPYLRWTDENLYTISSCKFRYNKDIIQHFDFENKEISVEYELELKLKLNTIYDLDI